MNFIECLHLSYFPDSWKVFITATLRKPGKSDYTVPGAYRPIAEEECLGKILESVITEWLSAFAETSGLLSKNQYGGRPGWCTVDALLVLTQKIKDAWRVGKVASVLLMDISQAFPSVSHAHLQLFLKVMRLGEFFFRSFLIWNCPDLDPASHRLCCCSFELPRGSQEP